MIKLKRDLMKYKISIFLLSTFPLLYSSCASEKNTVYICTSKQAYAYHTDRECYNLNLCKSNIKGISKEKAITLNRTACEKCSKNTNN